MKKMIATILTVAIVLCLSSSFPATATEGDGDSPVSDETVSYAYLDLDGASDELAEKILEARTNIIYSRDWVADGCFGYVIGENGEVVRELPQFHDVFPEDWDIPDGNEGSTESSEEPFVYEDPDCLDAPEMMLLPHA